MVQRTVQLTIGLAAMVLTSAAASEQTVTVKDLEPFSHEAFIPAGSDLSSIRLERVKLVKAPTRLRLVNRGSYSEQEESFRDPGGSTYGPSVIVETTAEVYELNYSYTGQPLASDEYGGRNFTFSIYLRPEELGADVRQKLSKRKITPALAELFNVTASGLPQQRTVIDERNSRFCDGSYLDGGWVRTDRNCKDQIRVKTVAVPADYITVRIGSQLTKTANR
jgi:hypothetical protein